MDKDEKIRMRDLRLMKQQEIIELDTVDKEVRKLVYFRDMICDLPTCNDCINRECGVKPRPGEQVRYNCHLHIEEDGENA